jgi:hypothetical protein
MEQRMEFPAELIDPIIELHASTKAEAQRLKAEANASAQAEKIWADLREYLTKGWALHLLALADKEAPRLKKMRVEDHPAIPAIEDAYRRAKEERDRIFRRFPSLLEEAFVNSGLSIDTTSRHPTYTLESGFFRLEIDEKKGTARISDHEGRLAEIAADVQAIVEAVRKERLRIFDRKYNAKKFLQTLRSQYKAIIRKEKQPDGSSVPIRHITRRLGKKVKGFRTDEFLVDLSRLAQEGPFEIDGRRLDLQQTKNTNQGMLLHGAAGRGYVGFIVFKEA